MHDYSHFNRIKVMNLSERTNKYAALHIHTTEN